MAYQDNIVNVSISLDTTAVTVAGFGTPIFASEHRWFTERVQAFTSIVEVAAVAPTDSNEYAAAVGFFNSSVSPSIIKIGRRTVDLITFTPTGDPSVAGTVYTLSVTGTDDVTVEGTYTTLLADTADEVTAGLAADLTGNVTGVDVVDGTGTLTVSATVPSVDNYSVSDIDGLSYAYTTTETAADMVTAISEEDNDWYFMTSNDHTDAFVNTLVTGMAPTIEALEKLYFLSVQDTETLASWPGVAATDDVAGQLTEDVRTRSTALFHQDADTVFAECYFISEFATKNPGEEVWTNKAIGLSASQDPDTGNVLTATQRGNLADRNCNFIQNQGGVAIVRTGRTAGGERIGVMRFRDFLAARITEAFQLLQINEDKIPYTDGGINQYRSTLESVLSSYVTTAQQPKGLQEAPAYTTTFPKRANVSASDVLAGLLTCSFEAFLSGAITESIVNGSLTIEGLG